MGQVGGYLVHGERQGICAELGDVTRHAIAVDRQLRVDACCNDKAQLREGVADQEVHALDDIQVDDRMEIVENDDDRFGLVEQVSRQPDEQGSQGCGAGSPPGTVA